MDRTAQPMPSPGLAGSRDIRFQLRPSAGAAQLSRADRVALGHGPVITIRIPLTELYAPIRRGHCFADTTARVAAAISLLIPLIRSIPPTNKQQALERSRIRRDILFTLLFPWPCAFSHGLLNPVMKWSTARFSDKRWLPTGCPQQRAGR